MSRNDRKRGGVDEHLSLAEAAERMGISERTARRWIKSGKLRAYKPGRDYWIPESALAELVEESEVHPKGASRSSLEPSLFNGVEDERRRAEFATWLEERCGHAYLALPKSEFEEIFDRIPEDDPERRELALKINREYNVFCDFPRNVTPAERLSMRRMIRAAIPEVAVKHGIALMEGGLSREYQEEAARIFEVQSATENATA
jgi:excisionase family DNA binding protein